VGTGIMVGMCTSPYPSPYPIEKVGDSPYPYPYLVNARIPRQNEDGFGQYPRGRVYLPSLHSVLETIELQTSLGGPVLTTRRISSSSPMTLSQPADATIFMLGGTHARPP